MTKRYKAYADVSSVFTVYFDESDIPAGMDEYDYAQYLAEMGEFIEQPNSGEFDIYNVVEVTQ